MSKLNVFEVIIDQGKDVTKKVWLGTSKRGLHSRLAEGESIIKCEDKSDEHKISLSKLKDTLAKDGWGEVETDLIVTAVMNEVQIIT